MPYDSLGRRPGQPRLITRNALSARQWELFVLDESLRAGRRAWRSPPVASYGEWLRQLWSRTRTGKTRLALGADQTRAAWRRVVEESPARETLIHSHGPAAWAADAWRLLHRWRIDPATLRADADAADFATFLGWCRGYRSLLDAEGWADPVEAEHAVLAENAAPADGEPGTAAIRLVDRLETAPVEDALFRHLAAGGWTIASEWVPPVGAPRAVRLALSDPDEELSVAAAWAAQRLAAAPEGRAALVVDGLETRAAQVERLLAEALGPDVPVWTERGAALDANPAVAAALGAVEMLSPGGGFMHFSRWLRSPFHQGLDPERASTAAAVEATLRPEMLAQLGFLRAYRGAGLAQRLRRRAPDLASRIDAALHEAGEPGRRCTPTAWAGVWQRCLQRLGWPAPDAPVDARLLRDWENALERFAALTPILGSLTGAEALGELRGLLQRSRPAPLPPRGLHVFARLEQVGPGYDRVWVCGLTNRSWPRPAQTNPLLPRALQVAHGMPGSTPAHALAACRAATAQLLARAGELVVSWPAATHEEQAEPSALIEQLPEVGPGDLGIRGLGNGGGGTGARTRYARPANETRAIESVPDAPPPLEGTRIAGGAGTLDKQARCPLRAFCDSRLGTRALEPLARGLSPRAQGLVAHRAAERLMGGIGSHAALAALDARGARGATALDRRIEAAARDAVGEAFGAARTALHALFELECARFAALLRELADRELRREPFDVESVEQRFDIRLGAWTVSTRVDRVDVLSDGTVAILDYKTGPGARVQGWFGEPLRDPQLPLYAVELGERVSALAIVSLNRGAAAYRGIWPRGAFPARESRLPEARSWPAQRHRWREQLESLLAEYAAGDVRVHAGDADAAKGPYAPLSRVYELLADRARRID